LTNHKVGETPFHPVTDVANDIEHEPHVIGPVLDAEARSIENYFTNGTATGMPISLKWWTSLGDPLSGAQPVAFNKHVRRRPLGIFDGLNVASSKCDILERLIAPHHTAVIDL